MQNELKSKLERKNIADLFALSPMQEGMLFHYLADPESEEYREQIAFHVSGRLDRNAFTQAWDWVIGANELLRTVIAWEKLDKPVQIVLKSQKSVVEFHDLTIYGEENDRMNQLARYKEQDRQRGFDLRQGPLFRVIVCKLGDELYELILSNHHIISDGWSTGIILREFLQAYTALLAGNRPSLQKKASFKEYIKCLQQVDQSQQETFWRKCLADLTLRTPLPGMGMDRKKAASAAKDTYTHKTAKHVHRLSPELTMLTQELAYAEKVTPGAIFYTAWAILLQRYAYVDDVTFGVTVAGRSLPVTGIEEMVGLFINTVPFRVTFVEKETVQELLGKVNHLVQQVQEFAYYPLAEIQALSELNTGEGLFDSIVVIDNYPLDRELALLNSRQSTSGLFLHSYEMVELTNYALALGIAVGESFELHLGYNPERYDAETVERLISHYVHLLSQIAKYTTKQVQQIEMVPPEEKERILQNICLNSVPTVFPDQETTIQDHFSLQAHQTPEEIAVVFRDRCLTYRELEETANQLAHDLQAKGVGPESIVGLLASRSLEMVVGMLAILKAGAAYVPLDPDVPLDRIRYMVTDTGTSLILAANIAEEMAEELRQQVEELIPLEKRLPLLHTLPVSKPVQHGSSANLAYIIYTSGSTGRPKGVMVEGRGVLSLARWFGKHYDLAKHKRVVQLANVAFDVSVEEILVTLLNGATVYIPDKEVILNREQFRDYVKQHEIQVAQFVPLMLQELLAGAPRLPSLAVVICGGERLPEVLKDEILSLGYALYNHYGPTEVTVDALTAHCTADPVTLGRPIDQTRVYILHQGGELQPVGAVGELCIAGTGVARGYLNLPAFTAERFLSDPFYEGERMYRTGDLARWSPEGEIEFLGRLDEQVKIRGHRIEPGEIENCLKSHALISEAAVVAMTDPAQNPCLAAFVVPRKANLTVCAESHSYQVLTAEQRPDFYQKMEALHQNSWPDFFVGDQVVQRYWHTLYEVFPDWQIGLSEDGEDVLAVGNTIPLYWDGTTQGLPDGWDDAVLRGFGAKDTHRDKPNTLCVLAGAVDQNYQGHGMSYHLLKAMNLLALSHDMQYVLIPVRPTQKEQFPQMALEEYATLRREDGLSFDPWLRVHERLGGKVIGYSTQSQRIVGTVEEWEAWTGEHFTESGTYLVAGAMQPVEIDCAANLGVYYDQAVWVQHDLEHYRGELEEVLHLRDLRQYLAQRLPYYMIPASFTILTELPVTAGGKLNRKALQSYTVTSGEKQESYVPPGNEIESTLAQIWESLLNLERAGIHDHFFERGGHSLLATRLVSRVQKELGVDLPLRQIFKTPVLRYLAAYLSHALQKEEQPMVTAAWRPYYPLSSAQKRMYILHQLAGVKTSYNMPGGVWLTGNLHFDRLKQAFLVLLERHESLRTSFVRQNGEPVQIIHSAVDFDLVVRSIEEDQIEQVIEQFIRPFDLQTAPLFRVELLQLAPDRYLLLFDMDHIISDGVSLDIFVEELGLLYGGKKLPPVQIHYKDFALWQEQQLRDGVLKEEETFWLQTYHGEIPVLDLPIDHSRSGVLDFSGLTYQFRLPADVTRAIKQVAAKNGVTLFMYLFACYHVLLARYSGQDEIVVGTPVAGRLHRDLERVIGVFINTLALKHTLAGSQTFEDFLAEVKEKTVLAFENQSYPFDMLVERLNLIRQPGRNPLFDTMFILQTDGFQGITLQDLEFRAFELPNPIARFDLTLHAMEKDGEIEFGLQYRRSLFHAETIHRMARHYLNLIMDSVTAPEKSVADLNLMSEEEREHLLYQWNGVQANYPEEKRVIQLFEEQVVAWPDRIAVHLGDQTLTYQQLNRYANRLGRRLRNIGVGPEDVVAMLCDRSVEMVIGILGILKAGGAYLPVEPDYPSERIEFMFADSAAEVLVTQKRLFTEYVAQGSTFAGEIVLLDGLVQEEDIPGEDTNLERDENRQCTPSNLCYVIYTSGSTGKPKGVLVENRNVVRLLVNDRFPFVFSETDVWAMFHSYCFDFSVWEMYGALLYGGRLVIVPKRIAQDTRKWLQLVKRERITVLNQTPTVFYNLCTEELNGAPSELAVRYIIFGGEALQPALLQGWKARYPETRLINMYGITETTVHVTFKEITEKEIVAGISNIGKPIPTLTTYIFDENLHLAPMGVPGELFVGGDGVARGYRNRPELTAEKFRENPARPGERVYRSGDLVRMLSNGELEYLGRIDRQVKIRGFRIELGEIEKQLISHPAIESAVVLDKDQNQGEKVLAAYLVFHTAVSVAELREYLRGKLPEYMSPARFIAVDRIPLTVNGKIDRQALLVIDEAMDAGDVYLEPENEVEKSLAHIWSQLLQIERIGRNDDFFVLGGHSLKATSLLAHIEKEFGIEIHLEDIFTNSQLKELAQVISAYSDKCDQGIAYRDANSVSLQPIPEAPRQDSYPLSSAQKRVFVLSQFDEQGLHYNLPVMYTVEGFLSHVDLEKALQQLVDRHEAFRTFFLDGEEPVQRIVPQLTFRPDFLVLAETEWPRVIQEFIRPFDLQKAPLLRVTLVEGSQRSLLMIDMHHIIADGVSMKIFVQELLELYAGRVLLAKPKIQYKDYAVWLQQLYGSDRFRDAREYWLRAFSGDIPILNLPADMLRPTQYSFEGDSIHFVIPARTATAVKAEVTRQGVTLFMLLFAAYNMVLARLAGQEEIVVGTPIAGRTHTDLEQVIGMFVNTLAIKSKISQEKRFHEFLAEIKENTLQAFDHGAYPFEQLVDELNLSRDLSRNPLFDTMFVLQNTGVEELAIKEVTVEPYEFTFKIAKMDLVFNVMERHDQLELTVEYSTRLFYRQTVEWLVKRYEHVLVQVVSNPEICIGEVDLLLPEEKQQLLEVFSKSGSREFAQKTISQLFQEQVESCPEKTALVCNGEVLTYAGLEKEAERLAVSLRRYGISRGDVVGILLERSLDMVIAVLGVLQAGGAYLPIDPAYPMERISYMLEDSGALLLITRKELGEKARFAGSIVEVVFAASNQTLCHRELQGMAEEDRSGEIPSLSTVEKPVEHISDLAYVIYTSGSTGVPKGVMLSHRGIANLQSFFINEWNIGANDRILQFASISFDASVWEMYMALLTGAALYIPDQEIIHDPALFADYVTTQQITIVTVPPIYLHNLEPEELSGLRLVITAGSATTVELVNHWRRKTRYINAYGPTETTICASVWEAADSADHPSVPIGRPLDHTEIYVLDEHRRLQPIGMYGEICVSGAGLALGYRNRPELTAEKFVPHPFRSGEVLYRTGDLGRWLHDGNLEFAGRLDQQVKIRGYRIEPGEIESRALAFSGVQEAAVVDYEDVDGEHSLVLYYVAETEVPVGELKNFLKDTLPDYMIPTYFVRLPKLPQTVSGKLDRKALPSPHQLERKREYLSPANNLEEKLVQIWQEILGMEQIGVTDNFFELGGHSLKATRLSYRVRKELRRELPLRLIFAHPTVRELASYLTRVSRHSPVTLTCAEKREVYPLSSAQRRLFVLNQFNHADTRYNMPGVLAIEGTLDQNRLATALAALVARHEPLRSYFVLTDGEPVQRVLDQAELPLTAVTVEANVESDEWQVLHLAMERFVQPFDVSVAPLARVGVFASKRGQYLLFDLHHIIADGVSMEIIVHDFARLYGGEALAPLPFQYKDFAVWQQEFLQSEEMKVQEKHWLETFSGELPQLHLVTDFTRPVEMDFSAGIVLSTFTEDLTARLVEFAAEQGVTLFMHLFAGYTALLHRYSGDEDMITGTPIAGRTHADLEDLVGMFVNTLALRTFPAGDLSYAEYLAEVRNVTLGAYEHQDYPFERLVDRLALPVDVSRNPVYDQMFHLQNAVTSSIEVPGLKLCPVPFDLDVTKCDITLTITESGNTLQAAWKYRKSLFQRETMERYARHYTNLLLAILKEPELALKAIPIHSREEREQLLYGFNKTEVEFAGAVTLQRIFEEQVAKQAQATAIVYKGCEISYGELNRRANQLAWILREHGVKPDEPVGIRLERSPEMLVGILGVLKAGGAYLPVSISDPEKRIAEILQDSGARILLSTPDLSGKLDFTGEILDLNDPSFANREEGNLPETHSTQNLAYILYTSGSTGKPKGVMVEHGSVVNTIRHLQSKYPLQSEDVVLQSTVYTFDASVRELFWWYFNGSQCCLLAQDDEKDPLAIIETISRYRVTMMKFVPIMLKELLLAACGEKRDCLQTVRYVFVGGEALSREIVKLFYAVFREDTVFCNVYGPTETSIHATEYPITPEDGAGAGLYVSIGRPISNDRVYILDSRQEPVAAGVVGEIHISGAGVGRGYCNQPELTAGRFLPDPFVAGQRMYCTGDLGYWLLDGRVNFVGRVDHQVKIRGYRIETGEIERMLLNENGLSKAVVVDLADEHGNRYLCAYLVCREEMDLSAVRNHLSRVLPEYMIPSAFVCLSELPLTASGKVDRKALPAPDAEAFLTREYAPPVTELEKTLAAIWTQILGIPEIGLDDSFFELGGHSIKATRLAARVLQECQLELPLRQIFKLFTIREQASYLEGLEQNHSFALKQVEPAEQYPLSSAQKRIFFFQQRHPESTSYNMPLALRLKGKLDDVRFQLTLNKLIERHESLRTSFAYVAGEPVQVIHSGVHCSVEMLKGADTDPSDWVSKFIQPFDLAAESLLRVQLVEYADWYLLLMDLHHIVSDGLSMKILIREFAELYGGRELTELSFQYKDFAVWQNRFRESDRYHQEADYWLQQIQGLTCTIFPHSPLAVEDGQYIPVETDWTGELIKRMEVYCQKQRITRFVFILALFKVVLFKELKQEDLAIGVPVAGRNVPGLEDVIGVFLNLLLIRSQLSEKTLFVDYLHHLQETVIHAQENQNYPYEELYAAWMESSRPQNEQLFSILFNYMPLVTDGEMELDELRIEPFEGVEIDNKYDLTLYIKEGVDQIGFNLVYNPRLYTERVMRRVLDDLRKTAEAVLNQEELIIEEIELTETFAHEMGLDFTEDFDNDDFFAGEEGLF